MIERLLPADVSCVETVTDPPGADLFPEEEAIIARAVGKRRQEFTAARWCARQALSRIGIAPAPLLTGERGAPQWPPGVVGSITHCAGYRAAVVAHQQKVRSLGIDAEPHEPLPDGVLDAVSLPAERTDLTDLSTADPTRHWDRILFSCKETVYKTWYPLTREWLGFEDARLHLDPDGTFTADLLKPATDPTGNPLTTFTGNWLVENALIITAIAHL